MCFDSQAGTGTHAGYSAVVGSIPRVFLPSFLRCIDTPIDDTTRSSIHRKNSAGVRCRARVCCSACRPLAISNGSIRADGTGGTVHASIPQQTTMQHRIIAVGLFVTTSPHGCLRKKQRPIGPRVSGASGRATGGPSETSPPLSCRPERCGPRPTPRGGPNPSGKAARPGGCEKAPASATPAGALVAATLVVVVVVVDFVAKKAGLVVGEGRTKTACPTGPIANCCGARKIPPGIPCCGSASERIREAPPDRSGRDSVFGGLETTDQRNRGADRGSTSPDPDP
mmetsp:Transcript_110850/g.226843  ORF Transcript_110850/g.226843 Transcript_110850/m.226843 type:complete len:283 (-) Transcript_110850:204-1052(-)